VRAAGTEHDTRHNNGRQDQEYLFHRSFVYFPVEDALNGIRVPKLPIVTRAPKKCFNSQFVDLSAPMDLSAEHPSTKALPDMGEGWYEQLEEEFRAPYFAALKEFLVRDREQHTVFPKGKDIFAAFKHTPFHTVRVVILGQDPYHGPGQAHGLCFSVPVGVPPPPSLQNIFKELARDLQLPLPAHGDLTRWAQQGVLLLNATLTVRSNEAGSHQGRGWERFTDAAIRQLSAHREGLIFLLWGRFAQNKEALIDTERHYVLKAPHPSPLSAHRGFISCGHFGQVNELLQAQGHAPIDWTP